MIVDDVAELLTLARTVFLDFLAVPFYFVGSVSLVGLSTTSWVGSCCFRVRRQSWWSSRIGSVGLLCGLSSCLRSFLPPWRYSDGRGGG